MRTYAPADPEAVLGDLLEEPSLARGVVHHAVLPAAAAEFARFPDWVDARIRRVSTAAASSGRTPTRRRRSRATLARTSWSSRRRRPARPSATRCPILQALAEDPAARALLLFPTKALGQDQVAEFGELAAAAGLPSLPSTYDGDTPAPIRGDPHRRAGRRDQPRHAPRGDPAAPHEVVPALRAAPAHRHRRAAHLPRRLRQPRRQRPAPAPADLPPLRQRPGLRLLLGHDREPGELPPTLTGRPSRGRPKRRAAGERHLLVDPPVSTRRPAPAAPVTSPSAGRCRSCGGVPDDRLRPGARRVELILTGLRETLRESHGPRSAGARLPRRLPADRTPRDRARPARRRDPRRRRTNALELGRRHRRLDAAIIAGYPGSIAGTRQQFGRAGRRRATSVAVLVAPALRSTSTLSTTRSSSSTAAGGGAPRPGQPARPARAPARGAFELPFDPGEVFGPGPADDLLAFLGELPHLLLNILLELK